MSGATKAGAASTLRASSGVLDTVSFFFTYENLCLKGFKFPEKESWSTEVDAAISVIREKLGRDCC